MFQLVITIDDGGKLNVTGPIKDKARSYGMLELAKDAIREFHDKPPQVQEPTPEDIAILTKGAPQA